MSGTDRRDSQDASPPDATLSDLIAVVMRAIEMKIRVAAPARVVKYDPTLQRADLIVEQLPVAYAPDGSEVPRPPIALPRVPVSWPATPTGYCLPPLLPGATGHVIYTDRALSLWLQHGGPVDPISGRTHNLADAIFTPGAHPDNTPIASPMHVASTHTVVHGPLLALREGAAQPLVHGTTLAAAFTTWTGAIAAAQGVFDSSTGGPPYTAASPQDCAVYLASIGTATATLALTIAAWLSTTVFTT